MCVKFVIITNSRKTKLNATLTDRINLNMGNKVMTTPFTS